MNHIFVHIIVSNQRSYNRLRWNTLKLYTKCMLIYTEFKNIGMKFLRAINIKMQQ